MIIFFDRKTGKIEGTIDGRVHDEQHLKMWIGDPSEVDRIIIQWKPMKWFDKEGNEVDENAVDMYAVGYAPDHPQGDIIVGFEKRTASISDYKIDPKTKEIIKNE